MALQITIAPTVEPLTLTEAKLHLRVDHTSDDSLITSLIQAVREWCEGFHNRVYILQTQQLTRDEFPDYFELQNPPLRSVSTIKYIDSDGATQTLATSVYDVDTQSEPGRIALAYDQSWPTLRGDINSVTVTYKAGYAVSFTADDSNDVITATGHTYSDGDVIQLSNSGGALPAGLSANTNYYVRDVSGDTLKLAASSGGAAIDITDTGTGTHYLGVVPSSVIAAMKLLIAHLYEHREDVSSLKYENMPFGVKSLLSIDRIFP